MNGEKPMIVWLRKQKKEQLVLIAYKLHIDLLKEREEE